MHKNCNSIPKDFCLDTYPSVIICPSKGKLIIADKQLNVSQITSSKSPATATKKSYGNNGKWDIFEQTNLQGSISGTIQQGTIFKTTSGNIYEVAGLTMQLVLELQPETIVLKNGDMYKLIVKGFDEPLLCRKLN